MQPFCGVFLILQASNKLKWTATLLAWLLLLQGASLAPAMLTADLS